MFNRLLSFLYSEFGVSKSGYFNFLKTAKKKEEKDIINKNLILKSLNHKGYKSGARSIKIILEKVYNIVYNLKKIRKIMKKYDIICPHRKVNKSKEIAKSSRENNITKNTLNRNFKLGVPYAVLLTDISYLPHMVMEKWLIY